MYKEQEHSCSHWFGVADYNPIQNGELMVLDGNDYCKHYQATTVSVLVGPSLSTLISNVPLYLMLLVPDKEKKCSCGRKSSYQGSRDKHDSCRCPCARQKVLRGKPGIEYYKLFLKVIKLYDYTHPVVFIRLLCIVNIIIHINCLPS